MRETACILTTRVHVDAWKRTSYGEGRDEMKRLLTATLTTAALASCSALFMEQLPKGYAPSKGEPRCTTSTGWPLWDSLLVVTSGIGAGLLFKQAQVESENNQKPGTTITYGVLVGVDATLHLLSAVSGFVAADKCERARKERDAYTARVSEWRKNGPRPAVDAGVDAAVIDSPVDAAPFAVDSEEPPDMGK